jgi:molybdopterin converting factor small subunit
VFPATGYADEVIVSVVYCGILKDLCGATGQVIYLAEGDRVSDLIALVREKYSSESKVWETLAVAVNDEYAGIRRVLRDGDEVALLPPVSGGAGL